MKLIILFLVSTSLWASDNFLDSVKRMKWKIGSDEVEVVWIKDDKFPRFTMSIYFNDGALSDTVAGLTQASLELLTAGTSKESQQEIAEFFDFYGAKIRHSVTHEFSVLSIQGLTKDIEPVVGKFCKLFNDAEYPDSELESFKSRAKSRLKNLVTSHAQLADRVFRKISLSSTPFETPTEGTLKGFDQMTSLGLKNRLSALNQAHKVIYLSGPKEVKNLEKILSLNCGWKDNFKLPPQIISVPSNQSHIYLVPVPGANQAQIRIGRYMTSSEFESRFDQLHFMSSFLGGGFTSKLVQELRVKRGLTYSASAYASMQRDYGRVGVMTFSKNETTSEVISLIRDVFADVIEKRFTEKEFNHHKNHVVGGFAFGFEETSAFLNQIMLYDHQKRSLDNLVNFPRTISKMNHAELSSSTMQSFPWDKLTIVVVGDKNLEKTLVKIRPVKIVDFRDFL
jgi:zinc protease